MASQYMLETYTRLMTDSRIKVRVEGSRAYATKEEVVIPALPVDNERAMVYGTGYAMHEGGHILDSDYDAWPKFPPLANLANIFEDVRIEAKQMVRYSGARRRLSDLFENLVSDGYFEQPTEKDGTAARITGYLLYRMRATLLGQRVFEQYAQVAEKLCDESVPKNAMVRLKVMMYRITEATCTTDSIALAEAVLDMLKEEQEKAEEEAQQQQQPPCILVGQTVIGSRRQAVVLVTHLETRHQPQDIDQPSGARRFDHRPVDDGYGARRLIEALGQPRWRQHLREIAVPVAVRRQCNANIGDEHSRSAPQQSQGSDEVGFHDDNPLGW